MGRTFCHVVLSLWSLALVGQGLRLSMKTEDGQDEWHGFAGRWSYGKKVDHQYELVSHGDGFVFKETDREGKELKAVLSPGGDGYYSGEIFADDKSFGFIRVARASSLLPEDSIVSNFKTHRENSWGKDTVARRISRPLKVGDSVVKKDRAAWASDRNGWKIGEGEVCKVIYITKTGGIVVRNAAGEMSGLLLADDYELEDSSKKDSDSGEVSEQSPKTPPTWTTDGSQWKAKCKAPEPKYLTGSARPADMSWLMSDEFFKYAMMSCKQSKSKQGPKSFYAPGATNFIPQYGTYISFGLNLIDDVIDGRPVDAVAGTVDVAANIALGILTSGVSSIVQLVGSVLGIVLDMIQASQSACLQCVTSMMLEFPAGQRALRASGMLETDSTGFKVCGLHFDKEPSVLDISYEWLASLPNAGAKLTKVVTGPVSYFSGMFGGGPTKEELDQKAAELAAQAVSGGLAAVQAHRDSKHGLHLDKTGVRKSAMTVLKACFDGQEAMNEAKAWWHSTMVTGIVPGIQTFTLSGVGWDEAVRNPKQWEDILGIEICRPIDFRHACPTSSC